MPNGSGAVDLGNLSTEEKQAVEKMAEEHASQDGGGKPAKQPVLALVVLVMDLDGNVQAVDPASVEFLDPQVNPPTPDLVFGIAGAVQKDISAHETAQAVVQTQMQQAQMMAQRMQAQGLAQQVAQDPYGTRGGRN